MTLEEAIKLLKQYQGYEPMFPDGETLKHAFDLTDETVDTLLTALRPVSLELVEADRDGRCVVLPVKPGKVWCMGPNDTEPQERLYPFKIGIICDMDSGYAFGNTKEEAQAALDALKGERDG